MTDIRAKNEWPKSLFYCTAGAMAVMIVATVFAGFEIEGVLGLSSCVLIVGAASGVAIFGFRLVRNGAKSTDLSVAKRSLAEAAGFPAMAFGSVMALTATNFVFIVLLWDVHWLIPKWFM